MEAGVMGSYAQMVLDNELAGNIIRLRKGIVVNEDTLAFEGILKAMDGTRNFLGQKHTMKYLKTELNLSGRLAERNTWETWERNERKGIAEHATDEAERILREHQVPPLEDQQEKALDAIMAAAEKEVVKKKG
jgi:trimethylamine--corrinoid protein Co-methyltransferase